ncbi:SPFH domain-containing protein [Ammonicoccus fulvus]|uniref:SPFH domain-containing protein n=1 Tax=Ammonicoccus fulvus TaxID=3138240 RepID=A0ABZ3FVT6_9ACTN
MRVNRVELKAIDPPHSIVDAMEKQMRAERDKRATILHAEGERQSLILTAEGRRQQEILVAQGDQQACILRADGEARAIERVFEAVHDHDADPKVLAYKYLEMLPTLAQGENNTFFVIPGEFSEAMRSVSEAFGDHSSSSTPRVRPDVEREPLAVEELTAGAEGRPRAIGSEATPSARASIEEVERSVRDAHAEALELGAADVPEVADPEAPGQS